MVVYEVYARDARVRRHSRALVAEGHDVEVMAVGGPKSPEAAATDGVRHTSVVSAKYRGSQRLKYVVAYGLFTIKVLGLMARRTVRQRPDLVYVNSPPDALVFATWPARLRGTKVILDVHDMMSELYAAKFSSAGGSALRLIRFVERWSYRYADGLVTVADAYGASLRRIVGETTPVATVWNVPDADGWLAIGSARSGTSASSASLRIGHHGTIVERFGVDRAVQAVEALHRRGTSVTLEILGDGDFAGELQEHIERSDLGEIVVFDRRMFDQADLMAFTDRIDIGVAPYRPSDFIGHSLPTKVLEYLALGIPTIVTETEMIRRYLAGAVRMVPSGSASELVNAISELANPERRSALRRAGLDAARRYSWAEQRAALISLVSLVLSKAPAPKRARE